MLEKIKQKTDYRRVVKYGSSLGISLPKDIVELFGIEEKDFVEIWADDEEGLIFLRPIKTAESYSIREAKKELESLKELRDFLLKIKKNSVDVPSSFDNLILEIEEDISDIESYLKYWGQLEKRGFLGVPAKDLKRILRGWRYWSRRE